MSKKDILLEIGLEEMPARFVTSSMQQFADKVSSWLNEHKIDFENLQAFSTPRRLAAYVKNVSESQQDIHEEAKGPAKKIALNEAGEWTKAAAGFCRGQGMTVNDIYFKEINGIEYVHVKKYIKGKRTSELLPSLKEVVTSLSFPKNMRWANEELRYIRPIKWIVALFGEEVIPFTITNVTTGNESLGHRFLGKNITIQNPENYEQLLLSQYVIANPITRKEAIVSQLEKIEEENQWVIPIDPELLEEVTNLVEYPTALFGQFEKEFLQIPEEVLITSMKEHQRYFPVKSSDGELLPNFVTVRNGGHEHLEKVAKGNEKVLRARLQDAAFFYKEDQKIEIHTFLEKLKAIVYHEEIGTLAEKVSRVRQATNQLSDKLQFSLEAKKDADRAAEIAKFDLVTHMVYEFPELQGFMGEKYALQKGENPVVAKAINEHYMPRNAEDETPSSDVGAVLSIAEKMDTIVSCFAIGIIPSGSQDPYALRRQATGIVQTLIQKDWNIALEVIIDLVLEAIIQAGIAKKEKNELLEEILSFFKLRIKHLLQERGIRHDLIDAVLGYKIGAIPTIIRKGEVLEKEKDSSGFKESIEALSRVVNISSKAEKIGEVNPSLFTNESETTLFNKYQEVTTELHLNVSVEKAFEILVTLKPEIDQYFEQTMVMDDNPAVRENRLNLMAKIAKIVADFANVSTIIVK
ncbi:glycine--tRNA ligase subunit beta [Bacillus sp. 03113]|uniref:glycine--tRNA ligase subunit beta n=1 Tax=Bacillus sp. 03113 TaxID=2578211 RepID=UPI00114179E4|nr:glycine--tRNA ligase subunit beta [Bacillus sp. 03113]